MSKTRLDEDTVLAIKHQIQLAERQRESVLKAIELEVQAIRERQYFYKDHMSTLASQILLHNEKIDTLKDVLACIYAVPKEDKNEQS